MRDEEKREAGMMLQKARGFKAECLVVRCLVSTQLGTELTNAELVIAFLMETCLW